MSAFYESDRAVAEYLLFHYGMTEEVLPAIGGPLDALGFPGRCVEFFGGLPAGGRALDVGCAVGGASFALARTMGEVVGVDFSRRFIEAAEALRRDGGREIEVAEEGELTRKVAIAPPPGVDPARLRFQTGDAHALPDALGTFDAVLAANLIDRLADPRRFLARLPGLVRPGGSLVLTSPYTWLEEYTPRENWLGGFLRDGVPVRTRKTLVEILSPHFTPERTGNLPFLIREHGRKYQWSVAEATLWRRR